jgi:hypothetical protein
VDLLCPASGLAWPVCADAGHCAGVPGADPAVRLDFRTPFPVSPCLARSERPIVKDQETVQKFIELRARGVSFRAIAKRLGVATGTLCNWSREHQHQVQNLRAIEWEEFLDRTLVPREERVKALTNQLARLEAELAKRDLSSIPTARLHTVTELVRRRLERECGSLQFSASVQLSRDDDTREAITEWNP